MNNIFEKLTHNMTQNIESAVSLALHNKNQEVQSEHFLWALLANSDSVLNQMLRKMNIDKVALELDVKSLSEKLPKSSSVSKENIKLSKNFVQTLENGAGLMTQNGDSYLAVDTFILANLKTEPYASLLPKYIDVSELAKNLEALRRLNESFRERDMDKTYLAWVSGHPEPHAARMTSRLSKGVAIAGERMVVDDVDGKLSVTDYQVITHHAQDNLNYALISLKPHSGRTHQLRVQLQQEGHPILGDPKYASRDELKRFKNVGGKGLMLHAWRLRLLHPMTQQKLCLIASFPERMISFHQ